MDLSLQMSGLQPMDVTYSNISNPQTIPSGYSMFNFVSGLSNISGMPTSNTLMTIEDVPNVGGSLSTLTSGVGSIFGNTSGISSFVPPSTSTANYMFTTSPTTVDILQTQVSPIGTSLLDISDSVKPKENFTPISVNPIKMETSEESPKVVATTSIPTPTSSSPPQEAVKRVSVSQKSDSTDVVADVQCLVCGDSNAQNHYGTICCPSCKGFFRRSYLASKNLECYRGNCCVITKSTRNNCRACRYKKCLTSGMNPNEIRQKMDPQSEVRNSSPYEMKPHFGENDPSTSGAMSLPQIRPTSSIDPLFMNPEEAKLLASFYVNLERYCDNSTFNGNDITPDEECFLINSMLDSSVEDLLLKNSAQCPRFPIVWKPHKVITASSFKRVYARLVVFFCDWISHIPLFKSLCVSDKIQLFIGRLTQCVLLNCCFRTYKEGCGGLLLGSGNVFPFDKQSRGQIEDDQLRNMLSQVVDSVFADVIFPMKDLDINEDEYCILKATLLLFEGFPFNQLTDSGKEILLREKSRHKAALVSLILQKQDANPASDHLFKLIQVEHLTTTIEAVSNYIDKEYGFMNLFGLCGMRGKLVHECHVLKYSFC